VYLSSKRPVRTRGRPIFLFSCCFGLFPGVKWPGREANSSFPSSARVKSKWSYTPFPLYVSWRGKGDRYHLCNFGSDWPPAAEFFLGIKQDVTHFARKRFACHGTRSQEPVTDASLTLTVPDNTATSSF
jgi:hypothetical protein